MFIFYHLFLFFCSLIFCLLSLCGFCFVFFCFLFCFGLVWFVLVDGFELIDECWVQFHWLKVWSFFSTSIPFFQSFHQSQKKLNICILFFFVFCTLRKTTIVLLHHFFLLPYKTKKGKFFFTVFDTDGISEVLQQ